jgi:hypothetical protein
MAEVWIDPAAMTDSQIEAELGELAVRLRELRAAGHRLGELAAREWRLSAELRYRDRNGRSTYFARASDVELEMGGRFAKLTPTTVTGSEPIAKYPKLESGPWAKDECPPEPELGVDVNTPEPVGEVHELSRAKEGGSE